MFCVLRSVRSRYFAALLLITICGRSALRAGDPIPIEEIARKKPVSFRKEILPILRENCLSCHSASENRGDLVLETPRDMLNGGSSGPVIERGKGDESLLLHVASHEDDPVMPPEDNDVNARNLRPKELGLLKLWIDQGAKDDGSKDDPKPNSATKPALPLRMQPVYALAVSPDDREVAFARGNRILLHNLADGQAVAELTAVEETGTGPAAQSDLVNALAFSPEGNLLAAGGFQSVRLWQRQRNVQKFQLAEATGVVTVNSSESLLAVGTASGEIKILSAVNRQVRAAWHDHQAAITAIAFGTDDAVVYSADAAGQIHQRSVNDVSFHASLTTPSPVRDLVVLPVAGNDDDAAPWLATGHDDNIVRIWKPKSAGNKAQSEITDATEGEVAAEDSTREHFELVRELKAHAKPITSLATISNRPMELLSSSEDGSVRWWRANDGGQVRSFSHNGPVFDVSVSPDGEVIATAGSQGGRLWRTNGQSLAELKGDPDLEIALQQARRRLNSVRAQVAAATKALDDAKKDVPKKQEAAQKAATALKTANESVQQREQKLAAARKAKESAEQQAVAAAANVRQKQSDEKTAVSKAESAQAEIERLQKTIAQLQATARLANDDQAVKQLIQQTEQKLAESRQAEATATSAIAEPRRQLQEAMSAANSAAAEVDKVQKPFNDAQAELETAQREQNLLAQQSAIATVELKAAEQLVPVRTEALKQAEAEIAAAESRLQQADEAAKAAVAAATTIDFSPDGRNVVTGNASNVLVAWSVDTGQGLQVWRGHAAKMTDVQWLSDGTLVATSADETTIGWNTLAGWKLLKTINLAEREGGFSHRVTSVDFSPDGSQLAIAGGTPSRSGEAAVISVPDGKLVWHRSNVHDDVIYAIRFAPDGRQIATAGADRFIRLLKAADGQQVRRFEGHTDYVLDVAWQADGQAVVSAAADAAVKVWDPATADQRRTVSNFKRHVTSIRFAADTSDAFCVAGDGTARMLRTTNGSTIRNFNGATKWVHCCALSADGKQAFAGDADGQVFVWDTTNGRLLHHWTAEAKSSETTAGL